VHSAANRARVAARPRALRIDLPPRPPSSPGKGVESAAAAASESKQAMAGAAARVDKSALEDLSASVAAPEYVSTAHLLATLAAPMGKTISEEEWRAVLQGLSE
jgi:hypothetical protein